MNPFNQIDPGTKEVINVIIEIPKGSHNKYELDKASGLIKLDRANYGPTPYPIEYGFIPQTLAEDGDPYDVLVFATYPLHPGVLVEVRPVALMEMTDGADTDNKIIGVPVNDQRWDDVQDLKDLNAHTLKEIQSFFENIKLLKKTPIKVTIHGFKGKAAAEVAFAEACKMYEDNKGA